MDFSTAIFGTVIYASIKILGYSLFAKYLNSLFAKQNNIWKVGLIRTAIGVVLGILHNAFFLSFLNVSMGRSPIGGEDTILYFALLILLRIFEWGLIIFWFYEKKLLSNYRVAVAIALGVIWSFILDIPLLLGLFVAIASIC
jgi:hypothetical protein